MDSSTTLIRNYASMNDNDAYAFEVHEGMETNGAILMSLLEELQEEDRDEERLNSVIQSLEAEIIKPTILGSDGSSNTDSECIAIKDLEDSNLWNIVGGLDGQDCSRSPSSDDCNHLGWFEMDQVACSPRNDMNWYVDSCEYDQMDNCPIDHCEWVGDYSHVYCNGVGIEEGHVYSSIWQETAYDSIMYD
ncbi:unnamed protein product [Malus baccata var. baccata]